MTKFKNGQKVFYICDKNLHRDLTYGKQYEIVKVLYSYSPPWESDIRTRYTYLKIKDDHGDIIGYDAEFFSLKKPKTEKENHAFGLFDLSILPQINKLLKPHHLKLKYRTNKDQVKITLQYNDERIL